MGKNYAVHFAVVLLLFLSFGDISAQTEEYEYYYDYENESTSPEPIASTAVEMTTVTLVPQGNTISNPSTEVPVSAIPLVPSPTSGSTDEETAVDGETAIAVDETTVTALDKETAIIVSTEYTTKHPEQEDLSIKYTMRPIFITTATGNKTVTQFNGGKPLPPKSTTRTPPRTNSFQMPEIVLHIYTGMYGMHKQENKRRENSSNRGRNKSPERNKISLGSLFESWYGSGYNGGVGQNSWNPTYARTTKRRNYSPSYTGNYGKKNSQANNAFDVFKMLMNAFASSARSQPAQSGRWRM